MRITKKIPKVIQALSNARFNSMHLSVGPLCHPWEMRLCPTDDMVGLIRILRTLAQATVCHWFQRSSQMANRIHCQCTPDEPHLLCNVRISLILMRPRLRPAFPTDRPTRRLARENPLDLFSTCLFAFIARSRQCPRKTQAGPHGLWVDDF